MSERIRRQRRRLTTIEGRHFVGEWKVTAGNSGVGDKMRIIFEEDVFRLQFPCGDHWETLQELEYMPDTNTLENKVGSKGKPRRLPSGAREPARCITFWNCAARNKAKTCAIFAMRVGPNPKDLSDLPKWEGTEENGSWGADDG